MIGVVNISILCNVFVDIHYFIYLIYCTVINCNILYSNDCTLMYCTLLYSIVF